MCLSVVEQRWGYVSLEWINGFVLMEWTGSKAQEGKITYTIVLQKLEPFYIYFISLFYITSYFGQFL